MGRDADLLRPGEVLGDTYEIRGKLGEGGMGQVYEAHDRRLERRVAIKVAYPGTSVSAEARALAALRGHPSTVTVHALGEHRGMEYAVMDRIHGITLERHLDRRRAEGTRMSVAETVRVAAAMADGLAVVHEAGMAHRDVKPANVILAPNDRVVITDFGIFRPECDRTTCSSVVWGTPEYMAPEAATDSVAAGEMFLVDVYALGVVLFEMLTGAVPFGGPCATGVLWMQISAPVPDPRLVRPDTPRALADLTGGMMAKSPRARPQGMPEIAYQLRHLASEPGPERCSFSTVIAEDNAATAAILASLVGEGVRGGHVRVAGDGREALEMVLLQPPDLLVVDLHLPVMSGLQLCAQLAETDLPTRCRIVGTSATAERGELAALEQLGCVEYLPKGSECSTVLPRLAREAWSLRRAARRL